MSRVSRIQTNFTAGELSPKLFGRPDISRYANATETLENFLVFPHGGASRRSGTRFVKEVKDSSAATVLIPFEFSITQAYVIEFGNLYCRFYKDQGSILEANVVISGATRASPCVVTATGHGYSNGDEIYIASVVGMTELNGKYYKIKNQTTNTVELTDIDDNNIDSSGWTAYDSAGTAARVYTLTTTYLTADLPTLQFAQSADVLYVTHPSYVPRKISRTGHTAWTIADITFEDGPYQDENTTTTTLTPGAATGTGVSLTASATVGINDGDGFASTDVGRLVRIGHQATQWAASTGYSLGNVRRNSGNVYKCTKAGTSDSSGGPSGDGEEIVDNTVSWKFLSEGGIQWGYGSIAGYTNTTTVSIDITNDLGGTSAETTWRLGAFSGTTGYPTAVQFFEQRLFFAGTTEQSQTMWGSRSADYQNFTPGTIDDDPVTYTIATDQVNAIRWLSAGKVLMVGTAGGEFVVSATSANEALTPSNVRVAREGTRGAHTSKPVRVDNAVIYIQRQQRKIREFVYSFESDAFLAPDLTLLSEQVGYGGISELEYQQEPSNIIWGIRADGQLIGLTYLRDQQVVAWHRHKIGGSFSTTAWGIVESLAVIPGTGNNELWLIVKRTINGATRRFVEFLEAEFNPDDSDTKADAFYVDSGLTYSGSAVAGFSGLDHLEGETVSILGDGDVYLDQAVTSGAVSGLSPTVEKAQVGLPFTSILKTLRPEAGGDDGTAQGKTKRVFEVTFRFVNTLGAKYGTSSAAADLDVVKFRSGSDPMDSSPPLFTGDKSVNFHGNWETSGQITLVQDQPLPMTLSALMTRIITHDG